MKLSQIAAAGFAALTIGVASAAPQPSNVQPGGSLGSNPAGVNFTAFGSGISTYSFSLVDTAPSGFFTTFDLKLTDLNSIFGNPITVNGITLSGTSFNQVLVPGGASSINFAGLAAGSYSLSIDTTSSGFLSALGGKATAIGTVTPVPEAGSLAMAAAGLGVVGLIAARRRKV